MMDSFVILGWWEKHVAEKARKSRVTTGKKIEKRFFCEGVCLFWVWEGFALKVAGIALTFFKVGNYWACVAAVLAVHKTIHNQSAIFTATRIADRKSGPW